MSEKRLIGIALFPKETTQKEMEQLPVMQVYETEDGNYNVSGREIIEKALEEIIKNLKAPSMIFLAVEIVPGRERKRRRGKGAARRGKK